MKNIKSILAILLCLAMVFALAACGSEGDNNGGNGDNGGEAAQAVEYNVGEFSVKLPAGWNALEVTSIDGGKDTNSIDIAKGTSLFSDPYIRIDYYGPSTTMMALSSSLYTNVEELDTMEIGGYTWNGFKCTAGSKPLINLQTEAGEHEFQIAIWCEATNGTISLDDADVKAIIESITPNA